MRLFVHAKDKLFQLLTWSICDDILQDSL